MQGQIGKIRIPAMSQGQYMTYKERYVKDGKTMDSPDFINLV